jgi:hypothetical protein
MGESIETVGDGMGIMIVRPRLHEQTKDNEETFKRWTAMHFRDLLNLTSPPNTDATVITQTLRYRNSTGRLLYTIHVNDIDALKTKEYYAASRRLDLENTRKVGEGEEAVLPGSNGLGDEPMVWDLVNAEFGVFEEVLPSDHNQNEEYGVDPYQSLPTSLMFPKGTTPSAPPSMLVTITFNFPASETESFEPPKQVRKIQSDILGYVSAISETGVYTSLYRQNSDAQPDMHPVIAKGEDGNGQWVICVMVGGEVNSPKFSGLEKELDEWEQEAKRKMEDLEVKVGVWRGELFMS